MFLSASTWPRGFARGYLHSTKNNTRTSTTHTGGTQPDGQTLPLEPEPLDDVAEVGIPVPAVNASYSIFAETAPWPQQLQTTGIQEHIAQPSLAAVIELVSGIAQGEKGSPYRTSRQLGSSSLEARNQPATAIHLAILDYVADRTATASRPPG